MAEQHEELRQIMSQTLAPIHEELKALQRKAVIEEMINNAVKKLEEKLVAQDGKINLLQNRYTGKASEKDRETGRKGG